jgi:hypothetical protein
MAIIADTITVGTAGQRVQAPHKGNVTYIVFSARKANRRNVYVGGPDVCGDAGLALAPSEQISLTLPHPISTSQFWADTDSDGNKLDYLGTQ